MNKKISTPKELTSYWHALIAFQQAKIIGNLMIALKLNDKDNRSATLFGALCGYYARPFGQNNGIGRIIATDIIPDAYKARHDEMIYMRKKIFQHTDANAEMFEGSKINEIKFVVSKDGNSLTIENDNVMPKLETFSKIMDLLDLAISSVDQKITEYLNEIKLDHPLEANTSYSLKICEDKVTLKKA
jgi:hypothetical protein